MVLVKISCTVQNMSDHSLTNELCSPDRCSMVDLVTNVTVTNTSSSSQVTQKTVPSIFSAVNTLLTDVYHGVRERKPVLDPLLGTPTFLVDSLPDTPALRAKMNTIPSLSSVASKMEPGTSLQTSSHQPTKVDLITTGLAKIGSTLTTSLSTYQKDPGCKESSQLESRKSTTMTSCLDQISISSQQSIAAMNQDSKVELPRSETTKSCGITLDVVLSLLDDIKPLNALPLLKELWNSEGLASAASCVVRLLELWGVYWKLDFAFFKRVASHIVHALALFYDLCKEFATFVSRQFTSGKKPGFVEPAVRWSAELDDVTFEETFSSQSLFDLNISDYVDLSPEVSRTVTAVLSFAAPIVMLLTGAKDIGGESLTKTVVGVGNVCRSVDNISKSFTGMSTLVKSAVGSLLGVQDDSARTKLVKKIEEIRVRLQDKRDRLEQDAPSVVREVHFLEHLEEDIDQVHKMMNECAMSTENLANLQQLFSVVKFLYIEIRNKHDSILKTLVGKQHPTVIWIYGPSGVGKSRLLRYIADQLGCYEGKALLEYVRPKSDSFWSNYMQQHIVMFDDFNSIKDCDDHEELNAIYTDSAYLLNMAGVSDKGQRFTSKYVLIASNFGYVQTSETLNDPSILDRRRDFVIKCEDTVRLAGDQYSHPPQHYQDDWSHLNFTRMEHFRDGQMLHAVDAVSIQQIIMEAFQLQQQRAVDYDAYLTRRLAAVTADPGPPDAIPPAPQHPVGPLRNHVNLRPMQVDPYVQPYIPHRAGGRGRNRFQFGVEQVYRAQGGTVSECQPCFMLIGPPGIGKTTILSQLPDTYVKIDEFAESQESFLQAADLVRRTYDGEAHKPVVLVTNESLLRRRYMESGWSKEEREKFLRRLIIFTFSFRSKGAFKGTAKPRDIVQEPDGYKKFVSCYRTHDNGHKVEFSPLAIKDYMHSCETIFKRGDNFENFTAYHHEITPAYEFYIDFPATENFEDLSYLDIVRNVTAMDGCMEVYKLFLNHALSWKERYTHHKFDTWERAMAGFATLSPAYDGPTLKVKFKCGASYIVWSFEGRLLVEKTIVEVAKPVELKKLSRTHSFEMLEFFKELPWLDVLGFFVKLTVGFGSLFMPGFEPIFGESWGSDTEDDPGTIAAMKEAAAWTKLDKTKKVSRAARQQPLTRGPDRSGTGLMQERERELIQVEARRPRSLGPYGEGGLLVSDHVATEARGDTSTQGLVARLKEKPKVSLQAESSLDPSARVVMKTVVKNQVPLCTADGKFLNYAIGLKGHLYVTVSHAQIVATHIRVGEVLHPIVKTVEVNEQRDLWFFEVDKRAQQCSDICAHLLPKTAVRTSLDGQPAYFAQMNDSIISTQIVTLGEVLVRKVDQKRSMTGVSYTGYSTGFTENPIQTVKGDCGSPIILINSSYPQKFVGFHAAANSTNGLGAFLYREDVPLQSESVCEKAVVLSHQNVEFFEEAVQIEGKKISIVGTTKDGFVQSYPTKTHYYKSPFSGLEVGVHYEPAVLSKRDPRCSLDYDPIVNGILKYDSVNQPLRQDLLDICVQDIGTHIADVMQQQHIRLAVLTKTEAINRWTTLPGSNPIYRYSSAGFPWTSMGVHKKNSLFEFDGEIYHIAKTELGRKLNHACDQLVQMARRGERSAVVFTASNKDEPLKPAKIFDTNTRSIIASPIDYTLVHRQYCHTFSAAVTTLFESLPIKIGIDPHSVDWTNLRAWHTRVGDVGFAADFKGWDTRMHPEVLKCCVKIANIAYQRCDPKWEVEHDVIRNSLYSCMDGAFVLYQKFVFKMPGGQMTGQPQTALDNSLVNWIYAYYVWLILTEHKPKFRGFSNFMLHLACSFYGDDNIITINPEILDWFNFDVYVDQCSKLGLEVTPADKGSTYLPFQHIDELTFLKRAFVKIKGSPLYFGALDLNSIQRMLDWTTSRPHEYWKEPEEVRFDRSLIFDVLENILRESFLHGREFFEKVRAHLLRCVDTYGIVLTKVVPSFHDCFVEFVCRY